METLSFLPPKGFELDNIDQIATQMPMSPTPVDMDKNDDAASAAMIPDEGPEVSMGVGTPETVMQEDWEEVQSADADPFMSMKKEGLRPVAPPATPPMMGRTENDSATYITSDSACLDFFFKVVPGTEPSKLIDRLAAAWQEDSLVALKLLCHLRGVRGTGKSDKANFYDGALWLHNEHPKTLAANVELVAEFGYFKDLIEILLRLVEGPEVALKKLSEKKRHKQVMEQGKINAKLFMKKKGAVEGSGASSPVRSRKARLGGSGYWARKGSVALLAKAEGTLKPKEERIALSLKHDQAKSKEAAVSRKKRKLELANQVAKCYYTDENFQTLYLAVAKLFADQLKKDLEALDAGKLHNISLAAKWAPSLDSSYDVRTRICYAIACQIFPKESHPEFEGLKNHKYGYVVRERLRKDVLVPLRKVLELPEIKMSSNRWGEVNYKRVPSVAMKTYKDHFAHHDSERFAKFLEAVAKGDVKIAAGAVLPHEILRDAVQDTGIAGPVADLQWKQMVSDLKDRGTVSNCLAVCDVSGSMEGIPMEVCIALGMMLSEICEEPWHGHVITFSSEPQIHQIEGNDLLEKYTFVKKMDWGMNTNFQLVFDKVLELAVANKLPAEEMIKRLFVFSDMEFDAACRNPNAWETDYDVICRKFQASGYGAPPEIVFWNLRDSESTPVLGQKEGVALVSGFSKNILKLFLEGGTINPMKVMLKAIEGEPYDRLKVVD